MGDPSARGRDSRQMQLPLLQCSVLASRSLCAAQVLSSRLLWCRVVTRLERFRFGLGAGQSTRFCES
jgi:hypothetical protein